jgi:hypothetical protein
MLKKGVVLQMISVLLTVSIGLGFAILWAVFTSQASPEVDVTLRETLIEPSKIDIALNVFLELDTDEGKMRDVIKNYILTSDQKYSDIVKDKVEKMFVKDPVSLEVETKTGLEYIIKWDVRGDDQPIYISKSKIPLPEGESKYVILRFWG